MLSTTNYIQKANSFQSVLPEYIETVMKKMEQIRLLFLLIVCSQNVRGLSWTANSISNSTCESSDIYLIWSYSLAPGETVLLRDWKKSRTGGFTNVADDFAGFQAASGYTGRLTRIGDVGIKMSSATVSDDGIYYIFLSIGSATYNASAAVTVYPTPNASCKPDGKIEGYTLTCSIPDACPAKSYSGAVWTDNGMGSLTCTIHMYGEKYKCCANGAAITSCYSGEPLCIEHTCPGIKAGVIAGIVVGSVAGAGLIVAGVFIYIHFFKKGSHGGKVDGKKKRDEKRDNSDDSGKPMDESREKKEHAANHPKFPITADSEANPVKTFDTSERRPLPREPLPSLPLRSVNCPPDGGQQNLEKPKKKRKKQKKEEKHEGSTEEEVKAKEG